MRTVTFDPDLYKLVPVDQSSKQQRAGIDAIRVDVLEMDKQFTANRVYRHMIAAVPDQLPGVVEIKNER